MKLNIENKPIVEDYNCNVQGIRDYPECLKDSCQKLLEKKLDENGLFVYYRVDKEGKKSPFTTFTSNIDWLKKYTDNNRVDIVTKAIELCIDNLVKKIKDTFINPKRDSINLIYNSLDITYQDTIKDRDSLVFNIKICIDDLKPGEFVY